MIWYIKKKMPQAKNKNQRKKPTTEIKRRMEIKTQI